MYDIHLEVVVREVSWGEILVVGYASLCVYECVYLRTYVATMQSARCVEPLLGRQH